MKYTKSIIIALTLLGLFSTACVVALFSLNFKDNDQKEAVPVVINQNIRSGLEERMLNNMQQSMLRFNNAINYAFNDEFFRPFDNYFADMEQKFENMFSEQEKQMYELNSKAVRSSSFMIENTEKEFKVSALMQNVTKDMLNIEVNKGFLEIKVKHKVSKKDKSENIKAYSGFRKVIKLPKNIVADKAKTSFKDNVLIITFPKTELKEEKPLKLEVK